MADDLLDAYDTVMGERDDLLDEVTRLRAALAEVIAAEEQSEIDYTPEVEKRWKLAIAAAIDAMGSR